MLVFRGKAVEAQFRVEHQIGRQERIALAAGIDFQVRQRRQLEIAAIQPQSGLGEIAGSAQRRIARAQCLVWRHRPVILARADTDIRGHPIIDIRLKADTRPQPEAVAIFRGVQEGRVGLVGAVDAVVIGIERAAIVDGIEVNELIVVVVVKEVAFIAHANIAVQLEALRPFRQRIRLRPAFLLRLIHHLRAHLIGDLLANELRHIRHPDLARRRRHFGFRLKPRHRNRACMRVALRRRAGFTQQILRLPRRQNALLDQQLDQFYRLLIRTRGGRQQQRARRQASRERSAQCGAREPPFRTRRHKNPYP